MRYSKMGLGLVAVYLITATPLITIWAMKLSNPKGTYVIGQLATFPAGILISSAGLINIVMSLWWLNTLPAQVLLSILISYLIGWAIETTARILNR